MKNKNKKKQSKRNVSCYKPTWFEIYMTIAWIIIAIMSVAFCIYTFTL